MVRGGKTYHVFTQIRNVDDPFDGTLGGSPNDVNFIDYKYVKITISWDSGAQKVEVSSRFVPAGIEQPVAGQGVLVINVSSDKAHTTVPYSTVRITNSDTGFDETHSTDGFGRLIMVGLKEATKKYKVTLTKNDYETVSTEPPYPTTSYNPTHENSSVISGALQPLDMFQNKLSDFTIKFEDYLGNSVSGVNYYLKGGRQIGTLPDAVHTPLFNMDSHDQAGSDGVKNYGEISPGTYDLVLEKAGYKIIGIDSGLSLSSFYLTPGQSSTLTVKIGSENVTSLLISVINSENSTPVSGASVRLANGSGYDTTLTTTSDGTVFFPNVDTPPFAAGSYNIGVIASDFTDYSGTITVDASQIKSQSISLSPL